MSDFRFTPEHFGITNYKMVLGRVNVSGNVNLQKAGIIGSLPFRFGEVTGDFNCSDNKLTSCENFPESVGKKLYCQNNKISSFEGMTKNIKLGLYISNNKLVSLHQCPDVFEIHCQNNQIFNVASKFSENSILNLNNNLVKDISKLKNTKSDIYLHLEGNPLDNLDLEHLDVNSIKLSENQIIHIKSKNSNIKIFFNNKEYSLLDWNKLNILTQIRKKVATFG